MARPKARIKSNAVRQAAYRQRHLQDVDGKAERLNAVIDLRAKRALERLSKCYGCTQRTLLERLLKAAEHEAVDRAAKIPNGQADYYEGLLHLEPVTQ
jgi:hypothetical protein